MKKEELITKHLEGWHGLEKASIDHFAQTGRASGSFLIALKEMLEEYAKLKSSPTGEFGDYCTIEQNRYGSDNEHYIHKVIGRMESNTWVDVPVISNATETTHDQTEEVIACVCCGVSEREILRYRLKDIKLRDRMKPLPSNSEINDAWEKSKGNAIRLELALLEARKFISENNHSDFWETDIGKKINEPIKNILYTESYNTIYDRQPLPSEVSKKTEVPYLKCFLDWYETWCEDNEPSDFEKVLLCWQDSDECVNFAKPSLLPIQSDAWISVEQNPKDYDEVLVLLKTGEVLSATYCDDVDSISFRSNLWEDWMEITHWMLKPELKSKAENKN